MTRNIYLKFCIELISKVKFPKNSHLETAHFLSARVHSQTHTVTKNIEGPLSGPSGSSGTARLQMEHYLAITSREGCHQLIFLPGIFLPPDHHCGLPGRAVLRGIVSELWLKWPGNKGCEGIAGIICTNLMPVDVGFHQRLLTKWARCLKKEGERVCALFNAHSKLFILNMNMW